MKTLNSKCQGMILLFNFWLPICIVHKFTEECAVSLLFCVMPCLLFGLNSESQNSHDIGLSLGISSISQSFKFKNIGIYVFSH